MTNFYDNWLGLWDTANAEKAAARKAIHEDELEWVQTRQDAQAALMIAPETGFRTWGDVTMIAEIPVGWNTGRHKHGEEVLHVTQGSGFSVVGDHRYEWKQGSTLAIPFGMPHQHFNTGDVPARYVSTMAVYLEHLCGVHRTEQFSDCGATQQRPAAEPSPKGDYDERGRRVVLRLEDAADLVKQADPNSRPPQLDPDNPLVLGTVEGMAQMNAFHKAQVHDFMHIGKDTNGFNVREVEMSSILVDDPRTFGGTHAHMEAHLYILAGEGYTVMDGEKIPWRKGSAIQVPGPQTVHQHVNTGDEQSHMLRIASGIRYFFEKAATDEFPYLYISFKEGVAQAEART